MSHYWNKQAHRGQFIWTLLAILAIVIVPGSRAATRTSNAWGTGSGAWPVKGAIYEVSVEYFPHHSLNELTARIPTLQKLGISVIYITPIFQCADKAQYLILNYYKINPRYGNAADLKQLVAVAHQHGIEVLLDLVTSLTTDGSYIMTHHPGWILRGKDGKMQRYYPFPKWGWALDCTNPGLIKYFAQVARYYVQNFHIDGWRIDSPLNNYNPAEVTGDHSRTKLLRAVRAAITQVDPHALMMAEVPGPAFMWGKNDRNWKPLFDEMCQVSYNYPFCGFLGGNKKSGYGYVIWNGSPGQARMVPTPLNAIVHNQWNSKEFVEAVKQQRIMDGRLRANFIEDHDTARVAAAFPKQERALFVLICTMPGVPVVHAGQEIGSTVHPDASGGTNVVVDWKKGDMNLERFYAHVLKIRATNNALLDGDIRNVWKSGDKAITFLRSDGNNHVLTALNFGAKTAHCVVDLPLTSLDLSRQRSYKLDDEINGEKSVRPGKALENLDLTIKPYGYQIITISPAG